MENSIGSDEDWELAANALEKAVQEMGEMKLSQLVELVKEGRN